MLLRPIYWLSLFVACLALAPMAEVEAATAAPFKILSNTKNIIVWQRIGKWLMTTEDLTDGRVCYYYDPVSKSKLNLKEPLPGTWQPFGSAIKWLMYTDYYQGQNRLMAHDVDWHAYYIAWNSSTKQVGCGMVDTKMIYGQYRSVKVGDHYPVDLYHFNVQTGGCWPFVVSDSEKSQFAHDGSTIVYKSYNSPGDVGIYGVRFNDPTEFQIADRDGIEPAVYGSLVAWAEQNGSGYNIMAEDITTGEMRTIAYTTANPPCPEVGQGSIYWIDQSASTGLDIKGYDWLTNQQFVVTNATGNQFRLRVCGDLVTWVTGLTNSQILWGAWIQTPVKVTDLHASLVTSNSAELSWTSPGTSTNPPVEYDLRMRADIPIADSNWSTSTQVLNLPAPKNPGGLESSVVQNLPLGNRYFALKARLQNGDYSIISDCVRVYISSESDAMQAEYGSYISFSGRVTGVCSDGSFYCQHQNSPCGVRVIPSPAQPAVSAGQAATVTGLFGEDPSYVGPVLSESTIKVMGIAGALTCVAMSNKAIGGYDDRFGGTPDGGASNLYAFVKTWGRVCNLASSASGCSFYINDRSTPGSGIRVQCETVPPIGLTDGCFASVEGICRVTKTGNREILVVEQAGIDVFVE